jgi:phosphoribosylformylglycinamidine synthase subunit PurS
MTARVFVSLKPTVLDPQGQTIRKALNAHGHPEVSDVRQGKYFDVALSESITTEEARTVVEAIARDILANPVIEDYKIELVEG